MKALNCFFDLKDFDPAGGGSGAVYLFDGGKQAKNGRPAIPVIPFRITEGGLKLEAPLPADISDIWLGLPASMLGFRPVTFPFADMEKIRQTLPFELEGLILQGPEEVILEVMPIDGGDDQQKQKQKQKVLAVYAVKKELKALIESLKTAGAEPSVITSVDLARAKAGADLKDALIEAPLTDEPARMALAEAEFSAGPTVNFRRGELEFTRKKEEASRRLRTTFTLAALLLLAFAIKSAVGLYFIHRQTGAIEDRIGRSYSEIFPGLRIQNTQVALMELEAGLASLRREGSEVGGLPALDRLMALSAHRAGGVVISEISMDTKGTIIKGRAGSLGDITAEKNALEQGGASVAVIETRNAPDNKVLFTMNVRFAGRKIGGLPAKGGPGR